VPNLLETFQSKPTVASDPYPPLVIARGWTKGVSDGGPGCSGVEPCSPGVMKEVRGTLSAFLRRVQILVEDSPRVSPALVCLSHVAVLEDVV
jgi:hypothetical protein